MLPVKNSTFSCPVSRVALLMLLICAVESFSFTGQRWFFSRVTDGFVQSFSKQTVILHVNADENRQVFDEIIDFGIRENDFEDSFLKKILSFSTLIGFGFLKATYILREPLARKFHESISRIDQIIYFEFSTPPPRL